jgi:cell division septation protein DedD
MITQTANRSYLRRLDSASVLAVGAMCLLISGCAEIELGSELYKNATRVNDIRPAQPVLQTAARQDSIEPAMRPDPQAFHATGLALWDGAQTLQGVWIAHPLAMVARRVRLTNDETGAQVDAAMFRRDPNLSGPRIIVSAEAAELLGLTPGHGTPITINGLAYRTNTESTANTADTTDQPDPAPIEEIAEVAAEVAADVAPEATAEVTAVGPVETEVIPVAAAEPAPPTGLDLAMVDAALTEPVATVEIATDEIAHEPGPSATDAAKTEDAQTTKSTQTIAEEAPPNAVLSPPRPRIRPVEPAPDVSGGILDGRQFVQAGVFSQPENATRLVEILRAADLLANALPLTLGDKPFTRVLVGPYHTVAERDAALETVRRIGPADAIPTRG